MFCKQNHLEADNQLPYVVITEQPKSGSIRFRYECEGRLAGNIPGANSTKDNMTYPTIGLVNCYHPGTVYVSLVTDDDPPRPHPFSLVGDNCQNGICIRPFDSGEQQISFPKLGIQCKKRNDIKQAIEERLKMNMDPFHTHESKKFIQSAVCSRTTVCLCFQIVPQLPMNDTAAAAASLDDNRQALSPVVSDAIVDKQATPELQIIDFAPSTSSCKGGEKIIILCKKLKKQDEIEVVFHDMHNGFESIRDAETIGNALVLKAPPFRQMDITCSVEIEMFIRMKHDDNKFSEPMVFTYQIEEDYHKTTAGAMKRRRTEDALDPRSHCPSLQQEPHAVAVAAAGNEFVFLRSQLSSTDSSSYQSSLLDIHAVVLTPDQTGSHDFVEVGQLCETTTDNTTTTTPVNHLPSPDSITDDYEIDSLEPTLTWQLELDS